MRFVFIKFTQLWFYEGVDQFQTKPFVEEVRYYTLENWAVGNWTDIG